MDSYNDNELWLMMFLRQKYEYLDRDLKEGFKNHALTMIRESRNILDEIEKSLKNI